MLDEHFHSVNMKMQLKKDSLFLCCFERRVSAIWQHLSRNNLSDFLRLQEFYTQLKPELKAGGESISQDRQAPAVFYLYKAVTLCGLILPFLWQVHLWEVIFWVFRFFPLPLCLSFSSQINSFNFPAWILSGKHEHLLQRVGKETTLFILFSLSPRHHSTTLANLIPSQQLFRKYPSLS